MTQKELTCIGCPLGCALTVTLENDVVKEVTGYSCKIGIDYAHKECTHPTRILTTTIPIKDGIYPRLSIKSRTDIPKDTLALCIKLLKTCSVSAPIHLGDCIYSNIGGTGVDMIATQSIPKLD